MMRVIIAGSRKFDDYNELLNAAVNVISLYPYDDVEIVSGHALGADMLGERFASEEGYKLKIFPAHWEYYGKAAGPIRNEQMAKYAAEANLGILIAFPIGESKGTHNMIKLARQYGLEVHIFEQ